MHAAAYVGRASCYSSWPQSSVDHNTSVFDFCATTDQSIATGLERPLPHGRPQLAANPGQTFIGGAGGEFHLPSSAPITNGAPAAATDVKVNASSDESFCSSDDQPPSTNSNSNLVDGRVAPLPPLPSCHSRCPPSVVDAGGQAFSPLPAFAGYPFPVLPPASTSSLLPPPPPGYRFALGTTSRGRLQRQNGIKSSAKLASPSRTRSHAGSYIIINLQFNVKSSSSSSVYLGTTNIEIKYIYEQ